MTDAQTILSQPPPNALGHELSALLRGETDRIACGSERWNGRWVAFQIACIVAGSASYGLAMGWWRNPQQGLYVAIKFPLIILLTAAGNALINGMLAPQLGLNISFRQSFAAILMTFTIAASILGAFSPLAAFMVWNAPPLSSATNAWSTYSSILLVHVVIIAFAGATGNLRLFQLLLRLAGNRAVASRVLLAWLGTNFFLGSQLSWILRPFIGAPGLPAAFLRTNAFHGNFYESVLNSLIQLLHNL